MLTWAPFLALHKLSAVAVHTGIPWAASLASETPAISSGEVVQTVTTAVNLGVLGFVFWLLIQGRLHTDSENDRLAAELARVITEKDKAEAQLSEALRFARDELAPLLGQFTTSTAALLPILQQLVYRSQIENSRSERDNR